MPAGPMKLEKMLKKVIVRLGLNPYNDNLFPVVDECKLNNTHANYK